MSKPLTPITRLHNEKEESQRLGISARTLQQWRIKGDGPPFIKLGSAVRYSPEQVDAWLSARVRINTVGGQAA